MNIPTKAESNGFFEKSRHSQSQLDAIWDEGPILNQVQDFVVSMKFWWFTWESC